MYKILSGLTTSLNDHLRVMFRLKEDIVLLSPLKDTSGSLPANRVSVCLTGIERETAGGISFGQKPAGQNKVSLSAPSWHLNVYVLIGVVFPEKQYSESIRILTSIISYLQKNTILPLDDVDRPVSVDPVNLSSHDLSNLWSMMGINYVPSVFCRMRMLTIDEQEIMDLSAIVGEQRLDTNTV